MDSQPQEAKLNLYPCTACVKNRLSHMQTAMEKLPEPKEQRNLQTVLWFPKNRFTQIKNKERRYNNLLTRAMRNNKL
jgi:hypothetical protein